MKDFRDITKEIVSEAMATREFLGFTSEELAAMAKLYVAVFMESAFAGDEVCRDKGFRNVLCGLAETICQRSEATNCPMELSFLCPALFELTRTGLFRYNEDRRHFDTKLVESVLNQTSESSDSYRPLCASLLLLMQEPLTTLTFGHTDSGLRRYNFTIGQELYETTLRRWAKEQNPDGSWPDIGLEEALNRIDIFESDFGSIEEIDNKKLIDNAYGYYLRQPITTGTELSLMYHTYTCRWCENGTESQELRHFASRAKAMLADPHLTPVNRFALQYVILCCMRDNVL